MRDIKIIVATHKKYQMDKDEIYIPVHVGAKRKEIIENYQRDDEGENISEKNPYFCELTGLYWAWKNLKADYVGLVHYRRYFTVSNLLLKNENQKFDKVLKQKEIDKVLENTDIVLPKKRKYYIENLYDHYKNTLYIEPLDETKKILEERYPEYIIEFNKLHKRTSSHMFNMFIMKKELLNEYCTWLFDILFELEKRIDISQYDAFHARFFGRVSELLLDVWINTNKLEYKEIKVVDMQNVNWLKKGISFLIAKFFGKKYGKSF